MCPSLLNLALGSHEVSKQARNESTKVIIDHNDVFHFSPLKLFRDPQDAGNEVRFSSAHPFYLETPGPGDSKGTSMNSTVWQYQDWL